VCSEGAIEITSERYDPLIDTRAARALLACAKSSVVAGRGVVACLHAVTERDLSALAPEGIGNLTTARGDCETCENKTAETLERRVLRANLLAASRGETPLIKYQTVTAGQWQAMQAQALSRNNDIDQGRRALFGFMLKSNSAAPRPANGQPVVDEGAVLFRFVPRIDARRCVGCDACTRLCPHGALRLERDGTGLCYRSSPEACSGCGLCVDVCEDKAVSFEAFARRGDDRVGLRERRCIRCGAPFHVTELDGGDTTRCRICRPANRPGKLFEVRS
jgi:ferredoxin